MPCHRRHLILLCPLLLITLLSHSQQRRRDTLILHFALNSFHIQPTDSARLHETFDTGYPVSISITGYTDKTGSVAYNQRLSRQRADAAYRYVRQAANSSPGSTALQGRVAGGGVAPTPERSDSENRRVEIVYYTGHEGGPTTTPPSADTLIVMTPIPDSATGKSDSAQPSAIISLLHINFIVDTPVPTDATQMILPKYVEQLRRFMDHRLEIDGYVNSIVPLRGAKDPLFVLSVRRAKYIYDYLVNAGFDPAKLTYKGMGNASPINPTPLTREEMNANMRVEIKVY
jgi:outer membrane protein OmpA-like peptidoglycan-associated protein